MLSITQTLARNVISLIGLIFLVATTGCYVPLHSPAIQANRLSDVYRTPVRGTTDKLNLANLTIPAAADYVVGPNDTLEVVIAGLSNPAAGEQLRPIRARVMANGKVRLPLLGELFVSGMNLSQAQQAIDDAYSDGLIINPKANVSLAEPATFKVPVIGEATSPGVYQLQRNENDVAHVIALAGGLTQFAAEMIEVHRRLPVPNQEVVADAAPYGDPTILIKIPLRSGRPSIIVDGQAEQEVELSIEDITLRPGDVVVIPRQPDEVFFVVGALDKNRTVNFRVSDLDRRLGNAFLLPKDRDVDVVTAVAMAGYIDPIDSPSTVTVHRSIPGAPPQLIRVDLIAARYDWAENVYVQPGDIIYLNPDPAWWFRRTFDRIVPQLFTIPYAEGMIRWINPRRAVGI